MPDVIVEELEGLGAEILLRYHCLDLAAYYTDDDKDAVQIAALFENYCRNGAALPDNVRRLADVAATPRG